MKKLMIAAAAVCSAAMVHAAAASWNATAAEIHDGTGVEESYFSGGTALFFDAGQMSQAALFALWDAGTTIDDKTAGYVGKGTISGSGSASSSFTNGEVGDGKTYSYYFAIVDGDDKIYLSNVVSKGSPGGASAQTVGFGDQYDWDGGKTFPNSLALPTEGYVGEGRWAASAVPEPTSGLLLLLGVAGLALRRRRA